MIEKVTEKNQGEGNRDADKRYRDGVRETVEELDLDKNNQNDDRDGDAPRKNK